MVSLFARTAMLALLIGAPAAAHAQAADQPPGQPAERTGVSSFPATFFARSQPSSALDMVNLVPGFRLQEGDAALRGYSGAAGNVLIDGQRPASKQETLEDILKRIPARSVERIELVRSGASGFDMQGYALVANIVRNNSASLRGRVEAEDAFYRHDLTAPRVAGEMSYGAGDRLFELSGAIYRTIDDEHGFGVRNRVNADGSPRRIGIYGQPEGDNIREASASYRQGLLGGTARVTGLFKDTRMFANIGDVVTSPTPFEASGTERVRTKATELGLHYDRPLGDRNQMELLAIRRDTKINGIDRAFEPGGTDSTLEQSDAAETILRAVLRRQGKMTLEAGVEGAINSLDSHSGLQENGVDIPLPAANVQVKENRVEAFVTATVHPMERLTIEAGGRFEASKLTQSGDSSLSKSLTFFKPRLLATWTPSPGQEWRFLVEREVGQLDFANFVSSASLTSNSVTAGNKDLEPDSLWRAELAWERRFGEGSLVLTARHEEIKNLVDHTPVFSDREVFDAIGNIGDARRQELQADLNLPLDGFGLGGMTLQANVLYRHSEATDPSTGEKRKITEDAPLEASASFTHDITSWHARWGVNYVFADEETTYKVDEVEIDRVSDRVDVFVEYKPTPQWMVRAFAKNLTDSPMVRTRAIYTGLRGAAPLGYTEKRVLRSGPYVGFTVQRTFGG